MPDINNIKTDAIKRDMGAAVSNPNSIVLAARSKKNTQQTLNTAQKAQKVEKRFQKASASMENQKESAPTLQP